MTEQTVHFDNALEAQAVTGKGAETLNRVEKVFSVRLTARDTWVRVEGDEGAVNKTVHFFEFLRRMRNQGGIIKTHSISYALDAFRDGDRRLRPHVRLPADDGRANGITRHRLVLVHHAVTS